MPVPGLYEIVRTTAGDVTSYESDAWASARLFPGRRGAAATVTAAFIRQPPSENDVAKSFHGIGEPDRAEVQLAANVRDHVVSVLMDLPVAEVELKSRVWWSMRRNQQSF